MFKSVYTKKKKNVSNIEEKHTLQYAEKILSIDTKHKVSCVAIFEPIHDTHRGKFLLKCTFNACIIKIFTRNCLFKNL